MIDFYCLVKPTQTDLYSWDVEGEVDSSAKRDSYDKNDYTWLTSKLDSIQSTLYAGYTADVSLEQRDRRPFSQFPNPPFLQQWVVVFIR